MSSLTKQSIAELKLQRSRECFDLLYEQAYVFGPIHLIDILCQHVSRSSLVIYLYLLYEQKKNHAAEGSYPPIILSINYLARKTHRSRKTIERCFAELERKEFITREARYVEGKQRPSAIYLAIPAAVQQALMDKPKRRQAKIATSNQTNGYNLREGKTSAIAEIGLKTKAVDFLDQSISTQGIEDVAQAVDCNPQYQKSVRNISCLAEQEAYANYLENYQKCLAVGKKRLTASMLAWRKLTKEQQSFLNFYLKKLPEAKSASIAAPQKCRTDNINYNIVNINRAFVVDNITTVSTSDLPRNSMVKINKNITSSYIEKTMKQFIQQNVIPATVFRQKTLTEVIQEVIFHVENRSLLKTSSPLHALNGAKALLKQGVWTTPKKYLWCKIQEALAREREWANYKQKEMLAAKEFMQTLNYNVGGRVGYS